MSASVERTLLLGSMFLVLAACPSPPRNESQAECDNGKAQACYDRGIAYLELGGAHDPKSAARLFARGCDLRHGPSCASLGDLYLRGYGVPTDEAQAVAAYRSGCELREAQACGELARALELGRGVDPDPDLARELYAKACEGGADRWCGPVAKQLRRPDLWPDLHCPAAA